MRAMAADAFDGLKIPVVSLEAPDPFDGPGTGRQWFSLAGITPDNRPDRSAIAREGFNTALCEVLQRHDLADDGSDFALVGFLARGHHGPGRRRVTPLKWTRSLPADPVRKIHWPAGKTPDASPPRLQVRKGEPCQVLWQSTPSSIAQMTYGPIMESRDLDKSTCPRPLSPALPHPTSAGFDVAAWKEAVPALYRVGPRDEALTRAAHFYGTEIAALRDHAAEVVGAGLSRPRALRSASARRSRCCFARRAPSRRHRPELAQNGPSNPASNRLSACLKA